MIGTGDKETDRPVFGVDRDGFVPIELPRPRGGGARRKKNINRKG
jgi:hypothetical protein